MYNIISKIETQSLSSQIIIIMKTSRKGDSVMPSLYVIIYNVYNYKSKKKMYIKTLERN